MQRHMQRKKGYSSKIHNFAFPGATAEDNLQDQLSSFTKFIKESKDKGSALDSDSTTYCTLYIFSHSFLLIRLASYIYGYKRLRKHSLRRTRFHRREDIRRSSSSLYQSQSTKFRPH